MRKEYKVKKFTGITMDNDNHVVLSVVLEDNRKADIHTEQNITRFLYNFVYDLTGRHSKVELTVSEDLVKIKSEPKYVWGPWVKALKYTYINPFTGRSNGITYSYRTNGKRVQVRSGALSAMSSCNIEAGDKFDFTTGLTIALERLIIKKIASEVESKLK